MNAGSIAAGSGLPPSEGRPDGAPACTLMPLPHGRKRREPEECSTLRGPRIARPTAPACSKLAGIVLIGLLGSPGASAGTGRALLVGCSEYPRLQRAFPDRYESEIRLRGPANDVALMRTALVQALGYDPEHITELVGWPGDPGARPTLANIARELEHLVEVAGPGDRVVVYFAGHGSQVQARGSSRAEEPDGLDEILLPADMAAGDGRQPLEGALRDDDLARFARRLRARGAELWLIVDACHSGTTLRGGAMRLRGLSPDLLGEAPPSRFRPRDSEPTLDTLEGVVGFYGAQSYGKAPELPFEVGSGTQWNGVFTHLLAAELWRLGPGASFRELGERVVAAYQAYPCRITVPFFEGDLDQAVLAGAARPALFVTVTERASGSSTLELNRGLLAGHGPGSIAVVQDAQGNERARLEVTEAGLYRSTCSLLSGRLDPGSHAARVLSHPVDGLQPRLCVVHAERAPAGVLESLREQERVQWSAPEDADWTLTFGPQTTLRPSAQRGGPDRVVDAARVPELIERLARVHVLETLAVQHLERGLERDLDVWVELRAGGRGAPRRLRSGQGIAPGDQIRIRLQKRAQGTYDVTVLYLDGNFGITLLFPRGERAPRLEASAKGLFELTDWVDVVDDPLGIEHVLVLAVPRRENDALVNLSWLAQPSLGPTRGAREGGERHAIDELLFGLFRGSTRGLGVSMEAATTRFRLITLETSWPTLGAPRAAGEPLALSDGARATWSGPPELPDPWNAQTWARAQEPHVLLLVEDARDHVLLELSEEPNAQAPEPGAFDAELVVTFEAQRRIAHYDTDDDGSFDLSLIDTDGDDFSNERWQRHAGGWRADGACLPWLTQAHFRFPVPERLEATRRLRALASATGVR